MDVPSMALCVSYRRGGLRNAVPDLWWARVTERVRKNY